MLRIWWVFPSRTSARTALFAMRISNAATMPPPTRGISRCEMTPGQTGRELHPDLVLPLGREHVGDAVERLRRVVRVERREHEVTGLGDRQRELHGLGVAHLTDEDHVGVLAEGGAQRRAKLWVSLPTSRWLTADDLCVVHVLDRILDRDDVATAVDVDVVDDRRERRRLPRTRRSGDEHEPLGQVREVFDRGRQAELVECRQLERDHAQRHRDVPIW